MSGHTPGPWVTDCAEHDCPHQEIRVKGEHHTICTVWIDDAPVPDFNAEQEANARLIAAAPQLLSALMQIQRMGYADFGDRLMVEAAIAKATQP